jgi:hypothetical protein
VNPWSFIIAAYAITGVGTLALLGWSLAAMRRAEKKADEL